MLHWHSFYGIPNLGCPCSIFSLITSTESANILADALAVKHTLTELDLSYNTSITAAGWRFIFYLLQHPNSRLESLSLGYTLMNEDAAVYLSDALINNSCLKKLEIQGLLYRSNDAITAVGW